MAETGIEWTDKVCSKCSTRKPITEFCKDVSRRDGHSYVCLVCRRVPPGLLRRHLVTDRVGKKAAGRLLDGKEHSEYPAAVEPEGSQ